MTEQVRNWVWVASTQSVRDGKLSVLACAETVTMVALYWAIAWIWDTHLHLLAGVLVMPLMLFRSEESVEMGVRWAVAVEDRFDPFTENPYNSVFTILFAMFLFSVFGFATTAILLLVLCAIFFAVEALSGGSLVRAGRLALEGPGSVLVSSLFLFCCPILIRFASSLSRLKYGSKNISLNWRRVVFNTDTSVAPEPIPDPSNELTVWSYQAILGAENSTFARIKENQRMEFLFGLFVFVPMLLPTFAASTLFRLTLKSTAWFYLPILFLTSSYDGTDRLVWMRSFPTFAITKLRLVMALIGVGCAILAMLVNIPEVWATLQSAQAFDLPVVPLSLVLVLDWNALHPWHYASLPAAVLTLILYFRLDQMAKRERAGASYPETGFALRSMVWLDRLRSLCAVTWLALITPPTMRFFHCQGELPDWAARPLAWFFAPDACLLPLAT